MTASSRLALVRNMLLLKEAEEVSTGLAQRDIPCLYLKGAAFLDTLYPDLSTRSMSDVDILIPKERRQEVDTYLQQQGYEPTYPAHRPASRQYAYNWGYRSRQSGALLEMHVGFCQPERYTVDLDGLWRRSVVYQPGGQRKVPTLCPEDTLLQLAIHEAKHAFVETGMAVEDCRRIIAQWQPDWSMTVNRAHRWGAGNPLYVLLLRAQRRGADVPQDMLNALAPKGSARLRLALAVNPRTGDVRYAQAHRVAHLASVLGGVEPTNMLRSFGAYGWRRLQDVASRRQR